MIVAAVVARRKDSPGAATDYWYAGSLSEQARKLQRTRLLESADEPKHHHYWYPSSVLPTVVYYGTLARSFWGAGSSTFSRSRTAGCLVTQLVDYRSASCPLPTPRHTRSPIATCSFRL